MRLRLTFVLFLTTYSLQSQTLNFKSPEFLQAILKKYPEVDLNKDGKIQKSEADKMKELDLTDQHLKDAQDVDMFKNIEELSLSLNQIESIKLNDFKYLARIYCARNNLKELEISNMPSLFTLACGVNQLKQINIHNCPSLVSLNLMDNQVNSIDIKTFKKLKWLMVDNNKLEKLDISNNPELEQIVIDHNQIKSIDITKNQKLKMNILYIDKNVKIIGTDEQMSKYKPRHSFETIGE